MASVKVRADRTLEAAERLLAEIRQPNRMDGRIPEIEAVVAACKLALKGAFADRTGVINLKGYEPSWLLPYFQEPTQS